MLKWRKSRLNAWRKSTFCQNGECAELASDPDRTGNVLVRSTLHPGTVISVPLKALEELAVGATATASR